MGLTDPYADLREPVLRPLFGRRPLRTYPALLSTDAEARAWARGGAPSGAVVVADYQASPRGRAGLEWQVRQGEGLGFSVILRPQLTAENEGWLYAAATAALADVAGDDATISWPDEVRRGQRLAGAVGIHVELSGEGSVWAVVTVLVPDATPPRGPLLVELVDAIEQRAETPAGEVLERYRPRCSTIGRSVRVHMIPMGPSGLVITGIGSDVLPDGALVITTDAGRRVAARPQHLGMVNDVTPHS